ncbi:pseudouridine synthase [Psychrosphaera aestuarii]|uniref:pseudouridine synthase n=1 Tax=Psychrosphaera aestuarii TaxID=1266052 RepID=UPI001B3427EF|nr:pseudouridine synthase [Psychrosphaera aestuarii]
MLTPFLYLNAVAILNYQPPTSPYLDILYQDEDIVVLNKPSGLLSVPGRKIEHFDSLMSRVQTVWPKSCVVHRLDMMTSGVMVMSMHLDATRHLNKQFAERTTGKYYIAVVAGHMPEDNGHIDYPLIVDWPNRPKQKVCYETGKASMTYYEVLERSEINGQAVTRVKLTPITGRSHQLRVHLQQLGFPIIGDRLYAPENIVKLVDRLHLHAEQLEIFHPSNGEMLTFYKKSDF